ncbi:response regulator transcription factor [Nesterenkonia alba]|uniref:response regulator transcription factor n=1 Tax=Nesterenkonia alba TaxID=515814 RepID=UPI0004247C1A|nr:response regulator transcription factor [Nesterenkonia alba]
MTVGTARPEGAVAADRRIRLLLADDQDLVRGGLSALLNLEPDVEVVAEVGRGDQVYDAVEKHRPDVALIDIEMPGIDGIEAIRQLTEAGLAVRCLIVTTFGRPGYLRRAMDAGAAGFVVKDTPAQQLADMVRRVAAGYRVVDPALAAESLAGGVNPLTTREQQVLQAAADGGSVKSIAARLHLSAGTVRNHLSAAIGKTGAENRHDAARTAAENGWL